MEGKQVLTKSDWAKYPFTPEAAKYVKKLDIKIDELGSYDFALHFTGFLRNATDFYDKKMEACQPTRVKWRGLPHKK